jgi:hypothetical protein
MKDVKLRSILTNSENETTNVEAIGKYNTDTNTITYTEEELTVTVTIFKDYVKMNRHNEDYDLNLEFRLNERVECKYKVGSIGLNIDITVDTKKLEINENYIYVEYSLLNNEMDMGTFEYKLIFWE